MLCSDLFLLPFQSDASCNLHMVLSESVVL